MSVIQIQAFVHTFPEVLSYFSSAKIETEESCLSSTVI